MDTIYDMLYGFTLGSEVYARPPDDLRGRIGSICYYGACMNVFPRGDEVYVDIRVRKVIENNPEYLKTEIVDPEVFKQFNLVDVRSVGARTRKRKRSTVGFPFNTYIHEIACLDSQLATIILNEEERKGNRKRIRTEVGCFLGFHVSQIPCPACGCCAKFKYNRSKLIQMGATPQNTPEGEESDPLRLTLLSSCDICCRMISHYSYEYVCPNLHDICLDCAQLVSKELEEMQSCIKYKDVKIPEVISNLIVEFASSSYYNK